jgi:hypothetical protein
MARRISRARRKARRRSSLLQRWYCIRQARKISASFLAARASWTRTFCFLFRLLRSDALESSSEFVQLREEDAREQ